MKQGKERGQVDVMVVLHNLTQLLAQERNKFPDGMEDQVRWYYNQFELLLGFLTDNEEVLELHTDGRKLTKEIAELTYRTEDIVDTHYRTYKMANEDQQPFVLKMDHTWDLKKDIEEMIERIRGLISGSNSSNSRFQYDIRREKAVQMLNQSLPRTTRGWVADPEADLIVDDQEDCDILVDRLINGGPPEDLDFIAITGHTDMFNLVKKVYNDALVRDHFDSRAWVLLLEKPNVRNLLLSILKNIMAITPREIYEMEEWELKRELLKQLIGIRYLIVVECKDLGLVNCEKLVTDVFPNSKNGSRMILATDNFLEAEYLAGGDAEELCVHLPSFGYASYSKTQECPLFFVSYQDEEVFWEFFCKKIFGEEECPEELEHLGISIVESWITWPHVIVLIACILRVSEKTISRWSTFEEHSDLDEVLVNCYDAMPQHLKTCFLYLSVFPKNTEISVKQLIRLWIAEGLIQWVEEESTNNNNDNTANKLQARRMEDVAEKDYLEGLIGLNLVQVTNTRSDGGPKSCCIRQSEFDPGETFVHLYPYLFWEAQPRRLSIQDECENLLKFAYFDILSTFVEPTYEDSFEYFIDSEIENIDEKRQLSKIDDLDSNEESDISEEESDIRKSELESKKRLMFGRIRSLSCFDQDAKNISEGTWESIFKCTRLLRVLNLGKVQVGKLPEAMEKLFHLRYLSVKPAKINITVPKSIFNLWNLQTIDLRSSRFPELPKGIWKMQRLRHLYLSGDGPSSLPIPESDDCTLPSLQTLSFISIDPEDCIHLFDRAPNLRKLGLWGYRCFSISEEHVTFNLPHLQTLKFAGECDFEVPITLPDTITKISTVKEVYLQQNVIEMFGKLSNLQVLKLVQTSFEDGELVFEEGSFPQLHLLKFEASNIVTWRLEDKAMPNLHRLIINNCPQLIEPPTQLWKVNTLQELDLSWASIKFAKKVDEYLKGNEGLKLVVTFPLSSKSGT